MLEPRSAYHSSCGLFVIQVKAKYSEQFEPEEINALLALDKTEGDSVSAFLPSFLSGVDWKYEGWKWGVILTDNVSFSFSIVHIVLSPSSCFCIKCVTLFLFLESIIVYGIHYIICICSNPLDVYNTRILHSDV